MARLLTDDQLTAIVVFAKLENITHLSAAEKLGFTPPGNAEWWSTFHNSVRIFRIEKMLEEKFK